MFSTEGFGFCRSKMTTEQVTSGSRCDCGDGCDGCGRVWLKGETMITYTSYVWRDSNGCPGIGHYTHFDFKHVTPSTRLSNDWTTNANGLRAMCLCLQSSSVPLRARQQHKTIGRTELRHRRSTILQKLVPSRTPLAGNASRCSLLLTVFFSLLSDPCGGHM